MLRIAIDEPKPFRLHNPSSLGEALRLAVDHRGDSAYLAGGCDLVDQLKHQWHNPRHIINLKGIEGLRGIARQGDRVRIGALTKVAEIERAAELRNVLPALVLGAGRIASPQIRNMGTIGGNLLQDSRCPYYRGAWHCYREGGIVCDAHHGINTEHAIFGADRCFTVTPSDLAPVIVALDAVVHVRAPDGDRTIAARDVFVPPSENITIMHRLQSGEILTAVEIPVRGKRRSTFIKNTIRNAWDFSRASVAVALDIDGGRARDCRIVLGGVAVVPWRSRTAEQAIEGQTLTPKAIDVAAAAATRGAVPLRYNGYKVGLVRKLVREALTQLAAQAR